MKLEINGRVVEVDPSFANLTPEQQQATVEEIAASFPPPSLGQRVAGAMAPINQGIANFGDFIAAPIAGATNDILRAGGRLVGAENPPQLPARPTQALMDAAGIQTLDGRDPEGAMEAFLVGTGEAAAGLPIITGIGRLMQGANALPGLANTIRPPPVVASTPRTVAQNVGDNIVAPFINTPTAAVTAELAAGGGARLAQLYAEDLPDNALGDIGRAVAPVIGGFAGATFPTAATRLATRAIERTPVMGSAIQATRAAVTPFLREGAFIRAADRMRNLVPDPQAAAAAMQGDNPGNLTPAQMTRDPNLLSLERTVMDENPSLRDELLARRQQSQADLTEQLRAPAQGATAQDAQSFLAARQQNFRENLQRRVVAAEERAMERVMALDPARRESENAVIVRQELDRAYASAAAQERALWAAVPRTAEVPVDRSREVFNTIVDDTARARAGDIPAEARALLGPNEDGGFADATNVRELHGLYSKLRQTAREAMGQTVPNENRARIANEIANAILDDLGTTEGVPTDIGRTIAQARAFSAEMNEVFNQGPVGSVMSMMRNGGERVAPELTLSRTVGQGGLPGAVAVDSIRRTGDFTNQAPMQAGVNPDPAMQDFLQGRLMDTAAPRGQYDPRRAEDFIRANRELLQRFPELQGNIGAANMATTDAQAMATRVSDIVTRLDDPRQTVTTAFLRATPGNEIAQAVFKTQNPVRSAAALAQAARRDATGQALDGLKGAFLDDLIGSALQPVTTEGVRPISGGALVERLSDPAARGALARVFTPQELSRLDRLSQAFQGLEGARRATPLNAVIEDAPNTAVEMVMRVIAARQGAGMGGGMASLQTAQMASSRMQKLLMRLTNDRAQQLLRDAITDRDLFTALLMKQQTPSAVRRVENRLTEWMVGTGAISLSDLARLDREEQQ